jgi:hypothetical protein
MSTSSHPTFLRDLASREEHTAPACAAILRFIATRLERYEAAEERQAAQDRIKWATKGLDEPPITKVPEPQMVTKDHLESLTQSETAMSIHRIATRLSQLESMGVDVNALMDSHWKAAYEKAGLQYPLHDRIKHPIHLGPNPVGVDYVEIEQYRAPGARSMRDISLTTPEPIKHEYLQNPWPAPIELEGPPLPTFKDITWDHVANLTMAEVRAQFGEEVYQFTLRCAADAKRALPKFTES